MITIPTLAQLNTAIKTALETAYGVTIPATGRSFLRALVAVQAGKLKSFYLAVANTQKNIFPDTADPASLGGTLERFGFVKLGRLPFQAVAAQYELTVTGQIGGVIPAQTQFKSNDDALSPGIIYILDNDFTLTSSPDTITVRALTPGLEGKLNLLDQLTATAPIALVDSGAYVSLEIVAPFAAETTEEYRTAILNSYRLEPQGGSGGDYRIWSTDAQGVLKVYPYAKTGYTGEIDLFVEANIGDSIDGKGTPGAALLLAVEAVVEQSPDINLPVNERGRRPLQVIVNFAPISPKTVVITVTGFVGITVAQQALLLTGFTDALNNIRPFVSGTDILSDKNDILDTNKLIGVIITQIPGAVFASVSFTVAGLPLATKTFINGDIPWLDPNIIYV